MTFLHHDSAHSVAQYALHVLTDEFDRAVSVVSDHHFELPVGSTEVRIEIAAVPPHTVIRVSAPVAFGVPAQPEMFEFVARFGATPSLASLTAVDDRNPGQVAVFATHYLYGSCLDRAELLTSVANVAATADQLDEKFVQSFGGRRFVDLPENTSSV